MKIRQLENAQYAGRRFTARYQTAGYYDIRAQKGGFHIEHRPFSSPVWRSFDGEFFGECPEDPVAFGAFDGETLAGVIEACGFAPTVRGETLDIPGFAAVCRELLKL